VFTVTMLTRRPELGWTVESYHPDQVLAGAWRWVGEEEDGIRWAERRGVSVAVRIDRSAKLLDHRHVSRWVNEAWRRTVAEWVELERAVDRQLADLNVQARLVLGA
jgi:hypothetical protein